MEEAVQREEYLKNCREIMLRELIFIDGVCKKENISYTLISGTLLGAVRYKGFIPWDDDADIAMTRGEFEKFRKAVPAYLGDEFVFGKNGRVNGITIKNLSEKYGEKYANVRTDIFVADNIPDNALRLRLHMLRLKFIHGMMKRKPDYKTYGLPGKILVFVTSTTGKLFKEETIFSMFEKASIAYNKRNTKFVSVKDGKYEHLHLKLETKFYLETFLFPFENTELFVSKHYHALLSALYGENYMTPPSKEKQVPGHG